MLDSPTTVPPHPPRISEQNASRRREGDPCKKVPALDAHGLQRELVVAVWRFLAGPRDAGQVFAGFEG